MGRSHWGAGADLIQTPGFGDIPVRVLEALCVLRAVLHLHFGGSQLTANAFPDSQLECSSLLSASSPAPCPSPQAQGVSHNDSASLESPPAPQHLWFLSAVQPGIGDPELHQVRDGGM